MRMDSHHGGRLDGARVLVIDDHADERDLFGVLLEARGASVAFARSWREAEAAVARVAPDVLVAATPTLIESAALARLVRRTFAAGRARNPAMSALAVTPFARERDRALVLALGFDDHLPKPCEPAAFADAVAGLAARGA